LAFIDGLHAFGCFRLVSKGFCKSATADPRSQKFLVLRWNQEDEKEAGLLTNYCKRLIEYQISLSSYVKFARDPDFYMRMKHPHPGNEPQKPIIRDAKTKAFERGYEKLDAKNWNEKIGVCPWLITWHTSK